nr:olfactory receptor 150 [Aulacocentrum confusum]
MPRDEISPYYTWIYHVRTAITLTLIYSFAVTGTVGLVLAHEDIEDLTNNCFMLLSIVVITAKTINVIGSREAIIEMLETFEDSPCLPENREEEKLQEKVDRAVW